MIEVRYSKTQMWLMLGALIALGLVSLWVGQVWKGPRIFSSTTLIPLALVSVVAAARIALSDGIAFRATREQLLISGVWTKRRVAWSDVVEVMLIRETRTSRGEPLSPGSTAYLVFKVAKGHGGEEDIRLQYELFRDMPLSAGPGLVDRLRAMKQASAPVATRRTLTTPDGRDVLEGAVPAPFGRKRD